MEQRQTAVVGPLTEEYLDSAVRIHQASLGYTFNSRLGLGHLRFLYEVMCADDHSYVAAALQERRLVGIVSGTLDADRLKSRLLQAMSASRAVRTALSLILRPWLVIPLWQGNIVARPVHMDASEVVPILTAIGVDPLFQGRGIGRQLVAALEEFFDRNGVHSYRLDTLQHNKGAREFYGRLGFCEIANRAGSTIFVKEIIK
jgi:ribosomal protein S18 acetylase RimI-like enzyme